MRRLAVIALLTAAALAIAASGPSGRNVHLVYTSNSAYGYKQFVWVADADGNHARRLARGIYPRISPDGRWVAFGRCTTKDVCDRVYVVSSVGGLPRLLAAEVYGGLEWSPDSTRVATIVGKKRARLITVDVMTGKRLVLAAGSFWGFSFSPSGDRIVYAEGAGEGDFHSDLYVVSSRGGQPHRLTRGWRAVYPTWGRSAIAFARDSAPRYPPLYRTWRIETTGRSARLLTSARIPPESGSWGWVPVEWSEDGRRLLAYRATEFYDDPIAVDPERGTTRVIDRGQRNFYTERLSRDGTVVLMQGDRCFDSPGCEQVVALSYETGKLTVLVPKGSSPDWNR